MQVRKRDGRLEDFDRNKLKNSFIAAGVAEENAETFTSEVEMWTVGAAEEDVVETTAIWEKVVGVLEASDPEAANRYKAYRG